MLYNHSSIYPAVSCQTVQTAERERERERERDSQTRTIEFSTTARTIITQHSYWQYPPLYYTIAMREQCLSVFFSQNTLNCTYTNTHMSQFYLIDKVKRDIIFDWVGKSEHTQQKSLMRQIYFYLLLL